MPSHKILDVKQVRGALSCAVDMEMLSQATLLPSGHSLNEKSYRKLNRDPFTRETLENFPLVPNYTLRKLVADVEAALKIVHIEQDTCSLDELLQVMALDYQTRNESFELKLANLQQQLNNFLNAPSRLRFRFYSLLLKKFQWPYPLFCPLTGSVLQEPRVTLAGVTYGEKNLQAWQAKRPVDPFTGDALSPESLLVNRTLAYALQQLKLNSEAVGAHFQIPSLNFYFKTVNDNQAIIGEYHRKIRYENYIFKQFKKALLRAALLGILLQVIWDAVMVPVAFDIVSMNNLSVYQTGLMYTKFCVVTFIQLEVYLMSVMIELAADYVASDEMLARQCLDDSIRCHPYVSRLIRTQNHLQINKFMQNETLLSKTPSPFWLDFCTWHMRDCFHLMEITPCLGENIYAAYLYRALNDRILTSWLDYRIEQSSFSFSMMHDVLRSVPDAFASLDFLEKVSQYYLDYIGLSLLHVNFELNLNFYVPSFFQAANENDVMRVAKLLDKHFCRAIVSAAQQNAHDISAIRLQNLFFKILMYQLPKMQLDRMVNLIHIMSDYPPVVIVSQEQANNEALFYLKGQARKHYFDVDYALRSSNKTLKHWGLFASKPRSCQLVTPTPKLARLT